MDYLFGKFLGSNVVDENAVVVFTGDHGEEFYENGRLFHASHLSEAQTHVPLYYRFGSESKALLEKASNVSSHIDIFPTLIDYVCGLQNIRLDLDGESIFSPTKRLFNISARYNGGKEPFEFLVESVDGKILLSKESSNGCKINKHQGSIALEETISSLNQIINTK